MRLTTAFERQSPLANWCSMQRSRRGVSAVSQVAIGNCPVGAALMSDPGSRRRRACGSARPASGSRVSSGRSNGAASAWARRLSTTARTISSQPRVPLFEILDALDVAGLQPAELLAPAVTGQLRHAKLANSIGDLAASSISRPKFTSINCSAHLLRAQFTNSGGSPAAASSWGDLNYLRHTVSSIRTLSNSAHCRAHTSSRRPSCTSLAIHE